MLVFVYALLCVFQSIDMFASAVLRRLAVLADERTQANVELSRVRQIGDLRVARYRWVLSRRPELAHIVIGHERDSVEQGRLLEYARDVQRCAESGHAVQAVQQR